MIDEQWAREHVGTAPSVGGCGTSYHDERGDVQDCTSVEPCRACLRRRIEQLEAQRGGAVVVPESDKPTPEFMENYVEGFDPGEKCAALFGWREGRADLRKSIQPIPADRVQGKGVVGVDREEWEVTSKMARTLANWYNGHEINRTIWPPELQRYRAIDALRAQQAKGE